MSDKHLHISAENQIIQSRQIKNLIAQLSQMRAERDKAIAERDGLMAEMERIIDRMKDPARFGEDGIEDIARKALAKVPGGDGK